MALPGSCDDPIQPCCHRLYDMVEMVVDAAHIAVQECVGDDCEPFERYVNHGTTAGPGDYIAGWLSDIRPYTTRALTPGAKQLFIPKMTATIVIRLVERGYPSFTNVGGAITAPSPEEFDYAAVHSYSHAETALRAMLNVSSEICAACNCESFSLSMVRPEDPQSDQIAWRFEFTSVLTL